MKILNEKNEKNEENSNKITDEEIINTIEEEYGVSTTSDPTKAIYILRDGTLIDGDYCYKSRWLDHRIMELFIDSNRYDPNFWSIVHTELGVVMLVPETKTIMVMDQQQTTKEQKEIMKTLFNEYKFSYRTYCKSLQPDKIEVYYHGTTVENLKSILCNGFQTNGHPVWNNSLSEMTYFYKETEFNHSDILDSTIVNAQIAAATQNSMSSKVAIIKFEINYSKLYEFDKDKLYIGVDDTNIDELLEAYQISNDILNNIKEGNAFKFSYCLVDKAYNPELRFLYLGSLVNEETDYLLNKEYFTQLEENAIESIRQLDIGNIEELLCNYDINNMVFKSKNEMIQELDTLSNNQNILSYKRKDMFDIDR